MITHPGVTLFGHENLFRRREPLIRPPALMYLGRPSGHPPFAEAQGGIEYFKKISLLKFKW